MTKSTAIGLLESLIIVAVVLFVYFGTGLDAKPFGLALTLSLGVGVVLGALFAGLHALIRRRRARNG